MRTPPWTFDFESQSHSIIRIRGVRENWKPEPVLPERCETTFFDAPAFAPATPRLASAFRLRNVPYRWERGIRERVREKGSE